MNTDGYTPLRAPVNGNVFELSRADARLVFKHTVASIPDRIEALRRLCEANGLSNDPAGWTRMLSEAECEPDDAGELAPPWRSIVLDVSLAMSDELIRRSDGQLNWKFYTGSKNSLSFQHPRDRRVPKRRHEGLLRRAVPADHQHDEGRGKRKADARSR